MSGQPFLQFKSNGKNIKHIFFSFLNVISKKTYSFSMKKHMPFTNLPRKNMQLQNPYLFIPQIIGFFFDKKKTKAQRWVPLQVERLNSKVRDIIPYPSESGRNAQSLSYFHAPETQKKRMFGWKGMRCEV